MGRRSEYEFKKFTSKYGVEITDYDYVTLKIKKNEFNEEVLLENIKELVCIGYVKRNLLYHIESYYQEDEYEPSVPMTISVYTDQECSDSEFLKNLEVFVKTIMDVYNDVRQPSVDDMLEIKVTYSVDIPKWDIIDDCVEYYAFLSIEDVYEEDGIIYITFGLWG